MRLVCKSQCHCMKGNPSPCCTLPQGFCKGLPSQILGQQLCANLAKTATKRECHTHLNRWECCSSYRLMWTSLHVDTDCIRRRGCSETSFWVKEPITVTDQVSSLSHHRPDRESDHIPGYEVPRCFPLMESAWQKKGNVFITYLRAQS